MKTLALLSTLLVLVPSFAQIKNYDKEGRTREALYEKVLITYSKPTFDYHQMKFFMLGPLAVGAISAGIGTGVNAINKGLSKRAEKFASQYDAKWVGKDFFLDGGDIVPTSLHISRIAKLKGGLRELEMSHIDLAIENGGNAFRFLADSVLINRSKAKIKRMGQLGKTLDLHLQITIDAIWTEAEKTKTTLKSGTLGSASLTIPNVSLGKTYVPSELQQMYSDWIPAFPPTASDIKYTISVEVKEVNPYGVKSKEQSDFFDDNSDEITKLVQSIAKGSK